MKFLLFARRFLSQNISTLSPSLFLSATLAILAGCGGGSGPNVPTAPKGGGGGVVITMNTLQLLVSSPQLASSGTATVTLTAIVVSAGGQTVPSQAVAFSTNDSTAFINNISNGGVSDMNGIVTATLNLGGNRANRTITITATSGSATATNTVDVIGTTITVTGNNSIAVGATTALTFTVRDSAGVAIPGITVTVTSQNGNTVVRSPASGITNSSGQITATVTANVVGNDVITATGAGASSTLALTVSSASFAFTTPAAGTEVPLSTATPISITWTNAAGAPVVGMPVSFAASRGTITGSPAITNGAGTATASISSTSAGAAIITASGPGGTPAATLSIVFVATTASSVTVQAVPGTIQVTTGAVGQSNNSSTISVVVRDAGNNLVKNAGVNFTIQADPTGGSLTAARGVTDVNGTTAVTYIAGTISSAQNGVVIRATVTDVSGVAVAPALTSTASLTVSGQSLLVRLGTDNTVNNSTPPVHRKTWVAIVTDASGNAVAGAVVRFALRPGTFRKGFYFVVAADPNAVPPIPAGDRWIQNVSAVCPNEDVNFDGIVQPGEDTNMNGALEPGGAATVNASGTTDANGIATAVVVYPENFSTWAQVILEARTGVVGNDPPTTATFFLPGVAADYLDVNVAPPGQTSPFGTNASCASPS